MANSAQIGELMQIKGVGPALGDKLVKAGFNTKSDLIDFFPRQYIDYSNIINISDIKPGNISIKVHFSDIKTRRVRRSLHITEAVASDQTGKVKIVWFNQPYRAKALDVNKEYLCQGMFEFKAGRYSIINPSVQLSDQISDDRSMVPVYPEKSAIKSHQYHKIIQNLLQEYSVPETLPEALINKLGLIELGKAYQYIHSPKNSSQLSLAKRRFAYEELFMVMLASSILKKQNKSLKAYKIDYSQNIVESFIAGLPFHLTDSQRKVVWRIYQDIAMPTPMNRLVEGDVGSGKTVIAAMAILLTLQSRKQSVLVAPTEILANQHYQTIRSMLRPMGLDKHIYLLTGSQKSSFKARIKEIIANDSKACIIGTHAVFQKDIIWNNLALAIIDEQHRFGVNQRQSLHTNADVMPHILCLTATPIPRTLALTVYGELDISILDKPPVNKAGYETSLISPNSIAQVYAKIKESLEEGRQGFVVCPLIEASDLTDKANVSDVYKSLSKGEFKKYRLGLLHGRMKPADKDKVMASFISGEIQLLICTTVIEVGVDVPNATEMVILNADRFGLAQLHQLRGRVGRGEHKGHCYLVLSDSNKPSRRMRAIETTNDGFELAQYDMDIRGPGAIYGTRQHGELDLRFVDLSDARLISEVKATVEEFIKDDQNMIKYPQIAVKLQQIMQLTYLN